MKKTIKKWISLAAACVLSLGFSGCTALLPKTVSIERVEKTGSERLVDTYTIYYTDGTTGTFTITNGADGQDGKDGTDVTIEELYAEYVATYGEIEYEEFLALYLSFGADNSATINRCLLSTARVYCEFEGVATEETTTIAPSVYTGGAVIYDIGETYSYLLTNYHVVTNNDLEGAPISEKIHCYVYGSNGGPSKNTDESGNVTVDYGAYAIACEYVGGAATYDMAVLQVLTADLLAQNPQACEVKLADGYYVGQTAIAIGNPNGDGISVTQGIVSVDNEFIDLTLGGGTRSYRSLRMDTPLYKGNSGGGLFNVNGELIGITNAGAISDQNINYAVPLQIVKATTENILYYASDGDDTTNGVYKTMVGVTVSGQNSRYVYDAAKGYGSIKEEIVVKEIAAGSIAEYIGLQAGDILLSMTVDGETYTLDRYFDVGDVILTMRKGATFTFALKRGEEALTTTAYTLTKDDISVVA